VVRDIYYGEVYDNAVRKGFISRIDSANSFELVMKKLMANRTDFALCSRVIGEEIINRLGYENEIVTTGPPIEIIPSYFSFSKKADFFDLAKRFDAALREMKRSGVLEKIVKKYDEKYYYMFIDQVH